MLLASSLCSFMAARQLEFFRGRSSDGPTTDSLVDALAIAQHHDAVTGTEKQHVANDYAKRLAIGYTEAEKLVEVSLACLAESVSNSGCSNPKTKFEQCPNLNISYCPPTEAKLSYGNSLVVLVYNSLGWKWEDVIRIPVVSRAIVVHDSEGKEIESQLVPIMEASLKLRNRYVKAYLGTSPKVAPKYWLVFPVSIPPLGFTTYTISTAKKTSQAIMSTVSHSSRRSKGRHIEVGPGNLRLSFDAKRGKLYHYSNSRTSVKSEIKQSYSFYTGDNGMGFDPQDSTVLQGPLLDEVHQQINPWIYRLTLVFTLKMA